MVDFSRCGTGVSSYPPAAHGWFCSQDIIAGALPSGSGTLCYESAELCQVGLSSCGFTHTKCVEDYALCPTGVAGSAMVPHNWICEADYPPGAIPNGFGGWCAAGVFSRQSLAARLCCESLLQSALPPIG